MANGINTVKAADNGLTAITTAVESLKATVTQARQDASWKASSFSVALTSVAATDVLTVSGGEVTGSVNVDVANSQAVRTSASNYANMDFSSAANTFDGVLNFTIAVNGGTARSVQVAITSDTNLTVTVDGGAVSNYAIADADIVTGAEMVGALNHSVLRANNVGVTVAGSTGAALTFTDTSVSNSTANVVVTTGAVVAPAVAASFYTNGALTKTNATAQTVDQIVAGINANTSLTGKVKASNDNGKVSIQNLSTTDLTVVGATAGGVINGDTGAANTTTIGGNTVRTNLITQFNDLRSQLDKTR